MLTITAEWNLAQPISALGTVADVLRRYLILAFAFLAIAASLSASKIACAKDCALKRVVQLPMIQNIFGSPVVQISIDGQPRNVLLDTGGYWSIVDPTIAQTYWTRNSQVALRLGLQGVALDTIVRVPSIEIGSLKLSDVPFFEAPVGYLSPAGISTFVGTLGANWLDNFDVEIDPTEGTASLFSQDHCDGQVLYWPHSDAAVIPVEIDRRQKLLTVSLTLDGKPVKALIDTGTAYSTLSMETARSLFGLTNANLDPKELQIDTDSQGVKHQAYRHRFSSLQMSDIAFQNPPLLITAVQSTGFDMILGMHELRGLHLYFAYGEEKLYVTTARGDIAARPAPAAGEQLSGNPDPLALANASDQVLVAQSAFQRKDYAAAQSALDNAFRLNAKDPNAHVLRAMIYAVQGQTDRAMADLDQAILVAPHNIPALMTRSQLDFARRDYARAIADAGGTIAIDHGYAMGYLMRAQAEEAAGGWNEAFQDLGTIIEQNPRNALAYIVRSRAYAATGDYRSAFEDADQAARLQPKSALALGNRCMVGAVLGRINAVLGDCNSAVTLMPHDGGLLESRGFAHLKAKLFNLALDDYTAALRVSPGSAQSLYGRGTVEQEMGNKSAGAADIAAAQRIDPLIAQRFGKLQYSPPPVASDPAPR